MSQAERNKKRHDAAMVQLDKKMKERQALRMNRMTAAVRAALRAWPRFYPKVTA